VHFLKPWYTARVTIKIYRLNSFKLSAHYLKVEKIESEANRISDNLILFYQLAGFSSVN
jgi:hypothetical protein